MGRTHLGWVSGGRQHEMLISLSLELLEIIKQGACCPAWTLISVVLSQLYHHCMMQYTESITHK